MCVFNAYIRFLVIPSYYSCEIDDLIVSWDLLFSDNDALNWTSEITLTQGVSSITGTFEVQIKVKSKYLIGSTYDSYSSYYESVTPNGYLGITYVLDTNEFEDSGRGLSDANTCENRLSSSFIGKDFLTEYWTYTLEPSVPGNLGNDLYLEYGDQNIWNLSLIDVNSCNYIEWKNTFSFHDLWYVCKDKNNNPSYELIENDDSISLNLNFYLSLVSPNPLVLRGCNNGATDCEHYLVKTMVSHPLSIVFSKQSNIISNKDDVSIDLFTSNIIASVFIEESIETNTSAQFRLTLITSVPYFMSLNIDSALIISPQENELIINNNNLDFISNYYIEEDSDSYVSSSDCLIQTEYRCFQKFSIVIEINQCPNDGNGLQFDGTYFFSADFDCIDATNNQNICDDYLSDEPLSITLDSVNLDYNERCDSTLYEINWNGDITFYSDDTFNEIKSEFVYGDTVYTRVSINNDISNYDIFGMSIVQCYVCTSNISENGTSTTLDTCLSSQADTSLFYTLPQDTDLEFTNINSNISDTTEDFSFILKPVADDIFYVDCTVELEVNNVLNNNGRRSRVLFQSSGGSNRFQSYIGSGKAVTDVTDTGGGEEGEETGSNGANSLDVNFLVIAISGGIGLILLLIVVGLLWNGKKLATREREVDMKLELQMSTTRGSEGTVSNQPYTINYPIGSQTPTGGAQSVTNPDPTTPKMLDQSDAESDVGNTSIGGAHDNTNNDDTMDIYGKRFDEIVIQE